MFIKIVFFICLADLCPPSNVIHGTLQADCTRTKNSQCDYECYNGFIKNNATARVTCNADGTWKEDFSKLCVGKCNFLHGPKISDFKSSGSM